MSDNDIPVDEETIGKMRLVGWVKPIPNEDGVYELTELGNRALTAWCERVIEDHSMSESLCFRYL